MPFENDVVTIVVTTDRCYHIELVTEVRGWSWEIPSTTANDGQEDDLPTLIIDVQLWVCWKERPEGARQP